MKSKMRILIIVNPSSGRGSAAKMASAISERFAQQGVKAEIAETGQKGDAARIVRESATQTQEKPTCIVSCGGDGTMQEVAGALASLQSMLAARCPTMGVAPAGRCNDFARALGIAKSADAIVAAIMHGESQPIDLGCINEKFFCTVATVGIDAEISSYVDKMKMPLRGTSAYLYGAARVLLRYKPHAMSLTGDFGTKQKLLFLASSANTSSYGGAIRIAPDADPTDGLLDICVIEHFSLIRALMLVPSILLGKHRGRKGVEFIRTKALTIECEKPLELWADGELIAHTPARIEVVPAAIRVMVPTCDS